MTRRALSAVLAAAFLASVTAYPAVAEDKKLTPQQQKMKDCSAKWKTEKTEKKVSGRKAHNEFMKGCLKG